MMGRSDDGALLVRLDGQRALLVQGSTGRSLLLHGMSAAIAHRRFAGWTEEQLRDWLRAEYPGDPRVDEKISALLERFASAGKSAAGAAAVRRGWSVDPSRGLAVLLSLGRRVPRGIWLGLAGAAVLLSLAGWGWLFWFLAALLSGGERMPWDVGDPRSWWPLPLFIAIWLALHELAHALTSILAGASVTRLGVERQGGWLPAPYVDCPLAWGLPRRRRALVAAAGPLADLLLFGIAAAMLATFPSSADLLCGLLLLGGLVLWGNLNPFRESDGANILACLYDDPMLRLGALGRRTAAVAAVRVYRGFMAAYVASSVVAAMVIAMTAQSLFR